MTREHESNAGAGRSLRFQRRVREQDPGTLGTLTQHLLHDCCMRRASAERYVIHSGQDHPRDRFDTFIVQHVEARATKEINYLRASGVEGVWQRFATKWAIWV